MAPEHGGSAGFNAPAIPLADGGTEDRASEGKQGSVRPERNIIPGSIENTGFLSRFVVSFIHGKQEEHGRTSTPEMVTISRAEYDSQQAQLTELKLQNQWLLEQLGLAKKRQFGVSSERLQEGLMDQLSLMANEAEAYAYGTKNAHSGTGGGEGPCPQAAERQRAGYRTRGNPYTNAKSGDQPIWICSQYFKYGKSTCQSQRISEDILINKTKEVLDAFELSRAQILDKISQIVVLEPYHLIYKLVDGSVADVHWTYPSRNLSWTKEMREVARQRALEQHRKEKR